MTEKALGLASLATCAACAGALMRITEPEVWAAFPEYEARFSALRAELSALSAELVKASRSEARK